MSSSLVYLAWFISICLMIWCISSSMGAMFGRTAPGHRGVPVVLCGQLVDDLFVRIESNHVCPRGALFDLVFRLGILCFPFSEAFGVLFVGEHSSEPLRPRFVVQSLPGAAASLGSPT